MSFRRKGSDTAHDNTAYDNTAYDNMAFNRGVEKMTVM